MRKNMGAIDRIFRAALAVLVVILIFTDQITGAAAVILSLFAVIFLATSIVGFCPGYSLIGISTVKGVHKEGYHGEAHKGAH